MSPKLIEALKAGKKGVKKEGAGTKGAPSKVLKKQNTDQDAEKAAISKPFRREQHPAQIVEQERQDYAARDRR